MRLTTLTLGLLVFTACGLLPDKKQDVSTDADADVDADNDGLRLNSCDITCDTDGLDLEIDAYGAEAAEIEFYSQAVLIETFSLTSLDDQVWVAYPDWPAGTSFGDCGADADFVCVIRGGGDEVRESR